jgi:hypothetical protein
MAVDREAAGARRRRAARPADANKKMTRSSQ